MAADFPTSGVKYPIVMLGHLSGDEKLEPHQPLIYGRGDEQ